jgi:hypothetical protein
MPEFLMFIADDRDERARRSEQEVAANLEQVGAWWAEHERAGHFVAGAGRRLELGHTAKTVRLRGGRSTVTDGPFAETKEVIGGFGVINAPDMAAAVEIARTWPGLPVTLELRPVIE